MRFQVRLQPNASRDEIIGRAQDADGQDYLKVRIRAVPEKGKANKALETLLAKALGLPKSAVKVVGGGKSRLKTIDIDATDDEACRVEIRLRTLMGTEEEGSK